MAGSMELQSYDGPRYSLGIRPSSDDAVGSRQKFARRLSKGIGKLAGNVKGDRRKEDRRTCRKITGGCRSMWDSVSLYYAPEVLSIDGRQSVGKDMRPKKHEASPSSP
ncbi:hypothetical protein BHE74_00004818 [Ensete ventricosum]|nr:hypothetical protein BHE74_00004818 [Ensete ventricosum]RZR85769.1 hypothetical protein BHM03_00012807 [Ensete ventricosum]